VMLLLAMLMPLAEPRQLPARRELALETTPAVKLAGSAVILGVILFFVVFW
jgi:hypothetical protein